MSSPANFQTTEDVSLIGQCKTENEKTLSQRPAQAHRRSGTLKFSTKPLVFDALSSRELPLDALLSFPINWNNYLGTSVKVAQHGQTRRPNLNPVQKSGSSFEPSSSGSASSSLSSCSSSLSNCRRDDGPPKAKKQATIVLPPSPLSLPIMTEEDYGCGQLLGSSESDYLNLDMEEGALGLLNLDLTSESEDLAYPPTPALSDCDSKVSTPTSNNPTPLPTPKVSFRQVNWTDVKEKLIKVDLPLVSPFSEEPPSLLEKNNWKEWENICIGVMEEEARSLPFLS